MTNSQKKTKLLWVLGTGGLIGGGLATWIAPGTIQWYFTPPAQFGFNCTAPIEWALERYQWAQLGGVVTGMVVSLILYFKFRRPDTESPQISS